MLVELEGLGKAGSSEEGHAVTVRDNSQAALAWLRDKPLNTKCVTTKVESSDHDVIYIYKVLCLFCHTSNLHPSVTIC